MQVYWLYTRYEYSLKEYETDSYEAIVAAVEEFNIGRQSQSLRGCQGAIRRSIRSTGM